MNPQLEFPFSIAHIDTDGIIASSRDARALALAFEQCCDSELSQLWSRFADFLDASEAYLTQDGQAAAA